MSEHTRTPDPRTLLAGATVETLRQDAMLLSLAAMSEPQGAWRNAFLRLAALARAVAECEDRSLDLRSYAVPLFDDADVAWRVIEHYMAAPRERTVTEHHATLPQALATLLPPDTETTTDGK